MAEIICIECKSTVSDTDGYCPECGYPFDSQLTAQVIDTVDELQPKPQVAADIPCNTIVQQTLDSVKQEIIELQKAIAEIKQNVDSGYAVLDENSKKITSDIVTKIESLATAIHERDAEIIAATSKNNKQGFLTAFYKTLNSPNSMFEYMFYICIVQIIFVVVNLFLVTYVVTLVR